MVSLLIHDNIIGDRIKDHYKEFKYAPSGE